MMGRIKIADRASSARKPRHQKKLIQFLALPVVLVVAACSGGSGSGSPEAKANGKLPTVRIQGLANATTCLGPMVMKNKGFDTANGFQAEVKCVDASASTQRFLHHHSDITFDMGAPDLAVAQNKNFDVVSFTPELKTDVQVIVPADSPYRNIEDLKGKRIGQFGDDSTATLSMQIFLKKYHGLDFHNDFNLVLNAPQALVNLLAADEVDAIISFQPNISRAEATVPGGVRVVYDPEKEWREQTGGSKWVGMGTAYRSWIKNHPETARNVLKAWCQTANYINGNPNKVAKNSEYTEEMFGLNKEAGKQAFADWLSSENQYECKWTKSEIRHVNKFLDLMANEGTLFKKNPGNTVQTLPAIPGTSGGK